MMDEVTPEESPEAWRTTLDATSISAKQAADRSGEVLKLMTSGIGETDPLAALSDAMVLMDLKMDALSAKLDKDVANRNVYRNKNTTLFVLEVAKTADNDALVKKLVSTFQSL